MASDGLLRDRDQLETLFDELDGELGRLGLTADVVMVGGAWMLWHSQRVATRDLDSARRLDAELRAAVDAVGVRHALPKGWLNDSAAAFWPSGPSLDDCEIVYEGEALIVRAPAADVVFVMKLYRADPQDREDMITLWSMCRFRTPDEAVAAFENGYPHAPEDEYLVDYVRDIARDAAGG